jgi:hypothetical protein
MKLTQALANKVNKVITSLTHNTYFDSIPAAPIAAILESFGLLTSELNGIYCGHEGRTLAQVADNAWLHMTWYRMPSGRFEIVAYVS